MTSECEWCGRPVSQNDGRGRKRQFCSPSCRKAHARAANKKLSKAHGSFARGDVIEATCNRCGRDFSYAYKGWYRTKCGACNFHTQRRTKHCYECGEPHDCVGVYCVPCEIAQRKRMPAVEGSQGRRLRRCKMCAAKVFHSKTAQYCEDCAASRKRATGLAARARRQALVGTKIDNFDPVDLMHFYDWTCQCCGRETPRSFKGLGHDCEPIVFHIVSLQNGGHHTWDNSTLICRGCLNGWNAGNTLKFDGTGPKRAISSEEHNWPDKGIESQAEGGTALLMDLAHEPTDEDLEKWRALGWDGEFSEDPYEEDE